jgi:uncharacterized Zn finger protein (UPF0148 family)
MVAMSRETLEEGEESAMTPVMESVNQGEGEVDGNEFTLSASAKEQQEGSVAVASLAKKASEPVIEAKGSKFSTKSILKSRSDHVSMGSVGNGVGVQPLDPSLPIDGGQFRHDALMMDDEDDEISLQEIEVVHLDDQTSSSELERKVIADDDGTTTAERLFLTQQLLAEAGAEEDNDDDYDDFGSYHSSHYNQKLEHPLRSKPTRFGGDSVANTSIAVLRSDTSIPIHPTESRANTSIAAIRGDMSFPVVPQSGESPTNTSLGVLRGDPSGRLSVSNADTSAQGLKNKSVGGSSSPHLRRDMMERENSAATPILDESIVAVMEEDTPLISTERELESSQRLARGLTVDRFRSLISHSEDTPSPMSFPRKPAQSVGSSLASYGPNHVQQPSDQKPAVKSTTEPHTKHNVPVEALVSYEDRYVIVENASSCSSDTLDVSEHSTSCSYRRALATRVLGKKMTQGYSLTEHKCVKCKMPLMEKERVFYCVVCPVLRQHYRKTMTESSTDRHSRYSRSSKSTDPGNRLARWDRAVPMAIDSPPKQREAPDSPPAPSSKRNLTIDISNSGASSRKVSTVQRTPKALSESSVQNEMSSKSLPTLSQPEGPITEKSGQSMTSIESPGVSNLREKEPSSITDTAEKSGHRMKSSESPRVSKIREKEPSSITGKDQSTRTARSNSARLTMKKTEAASQTSPLKKGSSVSENVKKDKGEPSRTTNNEPSIKTGRPASIGRQMARVEAATQTSPVANPTSAAERVEGVKMADRPVEKGSKSSKNASLPRNPPSAIVSGTHDDESAKMSSITESYVTSFSAFSTGTSRRSTRGREVKARSQKPSLSRVKPVSQIKTKAPATPDEVKGTNRAMLDTASGDEEARESNAWRVDTESFVQNDPACIESLQSLSSNIHQIIHHGPTVGAEERSRTSKQQSQSSNRVGGSSHGDKLSNSASEKKLADSVIRRKTKRLQELENARRAHEAAEHESTGMLAEFNHMLQQEILKEEMDVRSEIEAAVIHRREAEQTEQQQAEERAAKAIRLAELEKAAETAQREAVDAMEKTRLTIEHVSSQLRSDVDGNRIDSPSQRHPSVDDPSRTPLPREIQTPPLLIGQSPTAEHDVSPRGRISDLQLHYDSQRAQVTNEIGKRMMKGWNLLDASCPNCVMPLLTDQAQKDEICVLCGVVGEIENETVERSVKTWTKGERVRATRTSSDSKRASASRKTTNSSTNIDGSAARHKDSSDDDTSADRRRLKRELLREIIAETSAYMSKKKGDLSRAESKAGMTSEVSTEQVQALFAMSGDKTSRKEQLRDLVKGETVRATERLHRHGPGDELTPVAEVAGSSSPKRKSKTKHDPASDADTVSPVLSLLRRGGDESSRADPPASVAGSVRNKPAVDADGAASWLEPLEEDDGPDEDNCLSSPNNVSKDPTRTIQADDEPKEAVLSPSGESVVVLEIPKGFDVNDEPTLRELIKNAQRGKTKKQAKEPQEVGLKLDTSFQTAEHRHVVPSPGMTEAALPDTNSPAYSKFTTNSDFSNKATYHEIDTGRSTAPVPSPGISVAPEPEIELPTKSLDLETRSGAHFPSSRRPATSPGMDRIERSTMHDDEESYVSITVSRRAQAPAIQTRRRGLSPERMRHPERRNKVTAIRPYTGRESSALSEARIEASAKRSTSDPRQAPESPSFSIGNRSGGTEERSVVSSSSRPRITPESVVRPRSTASTSSHDSAGVQGISAEGRGTKMLRLTNTIPSESMSTSIGGATSRAIAPSSQYSGRQPLAHPPVPNVPSFTASVRGRSGGVADERALLVQGELEQEAPDPVVVLPGQPILGGNQEQPPPSNENSDRVLSSREIVVVEGGPLSPGHEEDEDGYDGREEDDAMSGRGSVGSATLDAVLARIEETKRQLENAPTVSDDGKSITIRDVGSLNGGGGGVGVGGGDPYLPPQPHKLRELIDSLAAAAEEIEKQDRLDMSICF